MPLIVVFSELTRLTRQGCPLTLFLYLLVVDFHGTWLNKGIEGFRLPNNICMVVDDEFTNDANLWPQGNERNLTTVKHPLYVCIGSEWNNQLSKIQVYIGCIQIQGLILKGNLTRFFGFKVSVTITVEETFVVVVKHS